MKNGVFTKYVSLSPDKILKPVALGLSGCVNNARSALASIQAELEERAGKLDDLNIAFLQDIQFMSEKTQKFSLPINDVPDSLETNISYTSSLILSLIKFSDNPGWDGSGSGTAGLSLTIGEYVIPLTISKNQYGLFQVSGVDGIAVMGLTTDGYGWIREAFPTLTTEHVGEYRLWLPTSMIITELLKNGEMMGYLSTVINEYVVSENPTVVLSSTFSKMLASQYVEVREMANQLKRSVESGASGLLSYIRYLYDGLNNLVADDNNGTFSFTDSASLVPQSFASGLIPAVATLASYAISAIITVIQPVIGIIATGIITVTTRLIEYFRQASMEERLAVENVSEDTLPYVQYAPIKFKVLYSDIISSDRSIYEGIKNGVYSGYVKCLGGYVSYGPTAFDNSGNPTSFGFEFHPDVINRQSAAYSIANILAHDCTWSITESRYVTDISDGYITSNDFTISMSSTIRDSIREALLNSTNLVSDGLTGPDDDENPGYYKSDSTAILELYKNIVCNSFLFKLYYLFAGDTLRFTANLLSRNNVASPVRYVNIGANDAQYIGDDDYMLDVFDLALSSSEHIIPADQLPSEYTTPKWAYGAIGGASSTYQDFPGHPSSFTFLAGTCWGPHNVSIIPHNSIYAQSKLMSNIMPHSKKDIYVLRLPKYRNNSVLVNSIIYAVIGVVVATVIAFVSIAAYRSIRQRRALNAAKVEQAWNNFTVNPTKENYAAYRSTAFKANLTGKLIGGTRYDTANFWQSTQDFDTGSSTGITTISKVSDLSDNVADNQVELVGAIESVDSHITGSVLTTNSKFVK